MRNTSPTRRRGERSGSECRDRKFTRLDFLIPTLLTVAMSGCGAPSRDEPRAIRVATDWSKTEREAIARDFESSGSPIVWTRWEDQAEPVDVYLGGAISIYARLAAKGRLEPFDGKDARYWTTARRSVVGISGNAPSRTALADPRVDPLTLAWALGRLEDDGWPVAYAKLLDVYGRAQQVGWREGSARAAVARGEAEATIDQVESDAACGEDSVVIEEGAAVGRGARRMETARAFLRFLDERRDAAGGSTEKVKPPISPEAEALAADLLGSTLVDAQDELRTAVDEVDKAGSPPGAVSLLTPLPPWPPASVEKLLRKGGEEGATLLETLTAQLAPEPGARLWLSQSWLRPRRAIDADLLSELANVEHGVLAREPRFRAWLRAEWTQWARQRYRWVARLAASRSPLLTSIRSSEP